MSQSRLRGERRKAELGLAGFTLAELMVGIAITGIIASMAVPQFAKYKHRAQYAEAYAHLGAMYAGFKMYYGQDHWEQGTNSRGAATHCVPDSSVTTNTPSSKKTVLDWATEPAGFAAIGFTPPEPLLFNYTIGETALAGSSTYIGRNPGGFISGPGAPDWLANYCNHKASIGTARLQLEVRGRVDDGDTVTSMIWGLCTNADNQTYICNRALKPEEAACSVSAPGLPRRGRASHSAVWLALLAGFGMNLRRHRTTHTHRGRHRRRPSSP